jgi:hypothetical protein
MTAFGKTVASIYGTVSDDTLTPAEGFKENLDEFADQPVRRRQRLLLKALETKPLAEALMLARAVENFLIAPTRPPSTRIH